MFFFLTEEISTDQSKKHVMKFQILDLYRALQKDDSDNFIIQKTKNILLLGNLFMFYTIYHDNRKIKGFM